MKQEWDALQTEIARCELCQKQFPTIGVNCPPGRIPPEQFRPPDSVKVLFVGVAPPEKGRHFYTDPNDKLRKGLFSVLADLDHRCGSIDDFLAYNLYLLHTAKCAIKRTTKPSSPVSEFCASHYLKREIEHLLPEAVCWLSKNVCYDVCYSLCREWGVTTEVPFGKVFSVRIMGHSIHFITTNWPGRVWKVETKDHVEKFFNVLGLVSP